MKTLRENAKNILYVAQLTWNHQKKYFIFFLIDVLINSMNTLLFLFFSKKIIDLLALHNYDNAITLSIAYVVYLFVIGIITRINSMQISMCETNFKVISLRLLVEKQLTIDYEKIQSEKIREQYKFAQKAIGENGIYVVLDAIGGILSSIITIAGLLYIIRYLNIWIIVVLISIIIINTIGNIKRLNYNYHIALQGTGIDENMYYVRDSLTMPRFAKEVRLFDLKNFLSSKLKYYIDEFYTLNMKTHRKFLKIHCWTYIANGIQMFAVYAYVIYLFGSGTISIGDFVIYVAAILAFSSALSQILQSTSKLTTTSKYINSYKNFLHQDDEGKGASGTISNDEQVVFKFENVSFRYSDDLPYVLQNINLTIRDKEAISIVGKNGAGKTTFTKLLMRLYKPTEGIIYLNGVDINTLDINDYFRLFSTIFQDFSILPFTVKENIIFDSAYDENNFFAILKELGLDGTIDTLAKKEDSYITQIMDEDGIDLSGGERQKMVIARALYNNAPVCIMDEPTSELSPQSEFDIYTKFKNMTGNKTVIFISHRLSSCKLCDRILLLDNAVISEDGTHDELMNNKELYYEMFSTQAQYYKEHAE